MCSRGVFDREGKFHPAGDLDFAPLEEMFRQETLRMMLMREKITPERAELLRSWVHSGFAVNSDRQVEAEDREGLQSLLEYMERAPVSLDRLSYLPDGRVLYRGNFHPALRTDHRLVSGVEFLALLVPHVLLRYEVVIRSYGAASTRIRRALGWIKKAAPTVAVLEDEESGFVRGRRRNWARLIRKVWLDDPELCPRCGERMKILAAISSLPRTRSSRRYARPAGSGTHPGFARGRPGGHRR